MRQRMVTTRLSRKTMKIATAVSAIVHGASLVGDDLGSSVSDH